LWKKEYVRGGQVKIKIENDVKKHLDKNKYNS
jgi:hypothetical protein